MCLLRICVCVCITSLTHTLQVRRELIFALHELVKSQEARFLDVAAEMLADERERAAQQLAANNTPKKGGKGKLSSSSASRRLTAAP